MESDEVLHGGVANANAVVRRGEHVLRPSNPYSENVHAYLSFLASADFGGASVPVGIDPDGRERLQFIEGDVAIPRYPSWAQSDAALVSMTHLVRRLHHASIGFDGEGLEWSQELADPFGGSVVCHNDVCLENVVFRDGHAVAIIDFDYAAPGRPLFCLTAFARMCVPIDNPENAERMGWSTIDRAPRLRLVADTYQVDRADRVEMISMLDATIAAGGQFVLRRVEAGDPGFVKMWHDMGGMERFDRRREWWADRRDHYATVLLDGV